MLKFNVDYITFPYAVSIKVLFFSYVTLFALPYFTVTKYIKPQMR